MEKYNLTILLIWFCLFEILNSSIYDKFKYILYYFYYYSGDSNNMALIDLQIQKYESNVKNQQRKVRLFC